jgi:hypothetical protein
MIPISLITYDTIVDDPEKKLESLDMLVIMIFLVFYQVALCMKLHKSMILSAVKLDSSDQYFYNFAKS